MFHWNVEKLIDLACMEDITVADMAREFGCSVSAVEKQLSHHRGEIVAARKEIRVSEQILIKVLDLSYDGVCEAKIAVATNLSLGTVHRIIRMAKLDEDLPSSENAVACADSLAALQDAFPNKFYEEDPRAAAEYTGRPVFLLTADCAERMAA